MRQAVQDGVAESGISDKVVPRGREDLVGDQQRASIVAVIDDLQQIAGLLERLDGL